MSKHSLSLRLSAFLLGLASISFIGVQAQQASPNTSRLSLIGYGSARAGMTVAQASQALGQKLLPLASMHGAKAGLDPECGYVWPNGKATAPIALMIRHGKVVRIDLRQKVAKTVSGLSLGMSEAQLKAMYSPLAVEPAKYDPKGHTFTYRSKLPGYAPYTMRFETDGKVVTAIRSGFVEEVSWVEGCS